ncbi:MAG: lamin tail domain-containing protein [Gammaproteobacteria bacterium]|jgi:hypothetical protein|nr:hypothetical protein [Chromatiales bacterium]MDP6674766.1 lamin tail domain-containing protein [Gammaproteobacteria bacterium]
MAKWLVFVSVLSVAVSVSSRTFAATLTTANLTPNNLVITEYLANPIGITDADGEYFEIFNTTSNSIELGGLVVRDAGTNSFTVTALLLAPQSFAVFSNSDGASLGISPDYVYAGGMTLTNTADEIGLYRQDGMAIHQLIYTDGDFFGAGIAHELDVLDWTTPAIVNGPVSGTDFIAASALLPFNNTGSPGLAGNTNINLAAVPLPASVWMFGSTLGMLCWLRRKAGKVAHLTLEALTHAQQKGFNGLEDTDTAGPVPTGGWPVCFNRIQCR